MTESGSNAPAVETNGSAAAARRADAEFRARIEAHGADLHAHCSRMLGSRHDADDAFQETLLSAWRALPRFRGDSSFGTWLYRIATNVCLTALARRRRGALPVASLEFRQRNSERPPAGSGWIESPDPTRDIDDRVASPEARYERREALEFAFIASLRHLSPRQRAALVARDVLGFSAKDAATSLGTTVASVNSALHRARAAVEERQPDQSQQATLRAMGDRRLREIAERFADAFERGDLERILALLTSDAYLATAPGPRRADDAPNTARLEIATTSRRRPDDLRRDPAHGHRRAAVRDTCSGGSRIRR